VNKPAVSRSEFDTHIFLKQNHDDVYGAWCEAGGRVTILFNIAAHGDLLCSLGRGLAAMANFICPALVREVLWVVPDQIWEDAGSSKPLVRGLHKILARYPSKPHPVKVGGDLVAGAILGKVLTQRGCGPEAMGAYGK